MLLDTIKDFRSLSAAAASTASNFYASEGNSVVTMRIIPTALARGCRLPDIGTLFMRRFGLTEAVV
jgi:hypothetical protein